LCRLVESPNRGLEPRFGTRFKLTQIAQLNRVGKQPCWCYFCAGILSIRPVPTCSRRGNTWSASPKGFYKGRTETFKGFEFVDQLVAHLPPRRIQLVRAATERTLVKYATSGNSGPVSNTWPLNRGKRFISSERNQPQKRGLRQWIRPKCQSTMTVVAVIEDPAELAMIIWMSPHIVGTESLGDSATAWTQPGPGFPGVLLGLLRDPAGYFRAVTTANNPLRSSGGCMVKVGLRGQAAARYNPSLRSVCREEWIECAPRPRLIAHPRGERRGVHAVRNALPHVFKGMGTYFPHRG